MKAIFTLFIIISSSILFGQSIDISGGANINYFYTTKYDYSGVSQNKKGYGYSFGLGMQDLYIDSIPIRFNIGFDNYRGHILIYNGMAGGGTTTSATVSRYDINLSLYPLNFKMFKRKFLVNVGCEFLYLIKENTTGTQSFGHGYTHIIKDIKELNINNKYNFGFSCRLAYLLKISDNWFLTPQYLLSLGLTKDFRNIQSNTKSLKNLFLFGITRNIK